MWKICLSLPICLTPLRHSVKVTLPAWLKDYENSLKNTVFNTDEEMMEVAIEISARNIREQTGGPFGCAIFERNKVTKEAKLFSVGANRVTYLNNSCLHGETVAIQFAEQKLKTFTLRTPENSDVEYIMCTSCEPCAMCVGSTFWAAPAEMLCGATKQDAESIGKKNIDSNFIMNFQFILRKKTSHTLPGFDEGPVFPESYVMLKNNGTKVKRNILQVQGAQVLKDYSEFGTIYNG